VAQLQCLVDLKYAYWKQYFSTPDKNVLLEYQIYACYISSEVKTGSGLLPGILQDCFTYKFGINCSWSLTMLLLLFHKARLMLIFSQHLRQGSHALTGKF